MCFNKLTKQYSYLDNAINVVGKCTLTKRDSNPLNM